MQHLSEAWRLATSDGVPRRAFLVALVVGTILTLINQGDQVLAGRAFNWMKALLTYGVPYLVSTHGAVSFRMTNARRD